MSTREMECGWCGHDHFSHKPCGVERCECSIDRSAGRRQATEGEIASARKIYGGDDVEIDSDARASEVDDGAWVQAWVWVPRPERGDE